MTTLSDLLASTTFSAEKVEDISRESMLSVLEKYSLAAVRGLATPEEIRTAKTRLRKRFSRENDHPATGESPADLYKNFQKFAIGGGELREKDMPKCVRTFYNPIWADDVYSMREVFRRVARLRNLLMDLPLDFATDRIDDSFWTASRIHHYPAGGGFMGMHREDYIPMIYEKYGLKSYYQPLIIMSKKGTGPDCDFESGGGYFLSGDTKHYYEEECELGDVVIYDTRVLHGVSEIDPRKGFRQDSLEGRLAGFVTLYRDFSQQSTATVSDSSRVLVNS